MKKRIIKWAVGVLLVPVILFFILTILFYIPPIQNFAVSKATALVSSATGLNVQIEHFRITFLLDINLHQVMVNDSEDSPILSMEDLNIDLSFKKILLGKIDINGVELKNITTNTKNMIPGLGVQGKISNFFLDSHGIDLSRQRVTVNNAHLNGANLWVTLGDTAENEDTTASTINWRIEIEQAQLSDSRIKLCMQKDSTQAYTALNLLTLEQAIIDLKTNEYSISEACIDSDTIRYDLTYEPQIEGLDINHILLTQTRVGLDSIYFNGQSMDAVAHLKHFTMKEKCGLEVSEANAKIMMDSLSLYAPLCSLSTPHSQINANSRLDFSALKSPSKGTFFANINGEIGKKDIMIFANELPEQFKLDYPNKPITFQMEANGNIDSLWLDRAEVALADAFSIKASGTVTQLMDSSDREAHINMGLVTDNLHFVLPLLEDSVSGTIALPPMKLDGQINMLGQVYNADIQWKEREMQHGGIIVKAEYDMLLTKYKMALDIDSVMLSHFLPKDSLNYFSLTTRIEGKGTDFLDKGTKAQMDANLKKLQYGSYDFGGIKMEAGLENGFGSMDINSNNDIINLTSRFDAMLHKEISDMTFSVDMHHIDLHALRITKVPFKVGMCLHVDGSTNLNDAHRINGEINDIALVVKDTILHPKNLAMNIIAYPDTTYADIKAGDFKLYLDGQEGYTQLLQKGEALMALIDQQLERRHLDQDSLRISLPPLTLNISSGKENPIAYYLRMQGYSFNNFDLRINADPEIGLNGNGHIYDINANGIILDTVQVSLFQDTTGINFEGRVHNGVKNKQFVFDSKLKAFLHSTGAGINLEYLDDKGETGVNFGLRAEMLDSGINIAFSPINPIIAYRRFDINKDNYLFLGSNKKVEADIDMLADDGTGVKIYSTTNPEALQDITLSLLRLNIGELTSVIPYAPRITGFLNGDAHLIQTPHDLSVVVDMFANDMAYEKAPIGDIALNAVYLPNPDGTHFVDSRLSHNENEILILSGGYKEEEGVGFIDAGMELIEFPLSMANGFITDNLALLEGFANANLMVHGNIEQPFVNGWMSTRNARIKSPSYSLDLKLQDDSIKITNSHLNLDKLMVYSTGKNPLVFDGTVNFADFERILLNLRVSANNFELINAKRTQQASAYGKVYVDAFAMLAGDLSKNIDIRGRLGVLGNTNVTYILKDSPLTVEDRLSDLVTFVDFSDTTQTAKKEDLQPLNVNMNMTVNIDQGTQIHCLLSADRSKYIDLEGGGELSMNYSPQGDLTLNGRYTVLSGEMKYALPVIPLKTFTIKSGSYVDFNGPILNPSLNIAATERVRTTITENEVPRSVNFDVGLSITQTLENIGLEFTLDAPEDMTIQNELATMSTEQRGRMAVTMLATGMYLAEGNENGGFSTSNALNALLQSEINNIAGKALETIDLSLGFDQSKTAEGGSRTDYSFRFAKRFWGNRISLIIGGKVSTGDDVQNTGASLIDNVSLEYRLDKSGTRYVTLFYDKNYESLMEGEVIEMGAGLVLRRKMTRLGELFIFKEQKKKKMPTSKDTKK